MSAQTKYAAMSRRAAMTAAALAAMATLAGCGGGGAGGAVEGDMAMGAPEGAKVTVVEYASVTCHVCAAWQEENWEAFKTAYVDTNKVRYVFRELPTGPINVAVDDRLRPPARGEGQGGKGEEQVAEQDHRISSQLWRRRSFPTVRRGSCRRHVRH